MKYEQFDLERALAGEPVILRDGRKAYVRHHEKTLTLRGDGRPLLGYRIYDGLAVEASWGSDGLWLRGREFPKDIMGMYPKHRLVNGVKVPAPEAQAPEEGTTYYFPILHTIDLYGTDEWYRDEEWHKRYLKRGLVFLNKEDAIANAKAMLGIAEDNDASN